jgi:hypothetical protein
MLMHEKGTDKMTAAIAILIVNFTRYICSAACELIFGSRTNQRAPILPQEFSLFFVSLVCGSLSEKRVESN